MIYLKLSAGWNWRNG